MRTDLLKFAESLCEYFANIGTKMSQKLPCSDAFSFKIRRKSCMHSFMLHEITPEEVSNCIFNFKPYSATGMDGIPPEFVKLARCILFHILLSYSINVQNKKFFGVILK